MGDMHDTLSATETGTHRAPFSHNEESNQTETQTEGQTKRCALNRKFLPGCLPPTAADHLITLLFGANNLRQTLSAN